MAKKYSQLTEREEAIYEIYSCLDGIEDYMDYMTSGNFMNNKNGAKFFVHRIQNVLKEIGIEKPNVEE